eukprot:scaffold4433_cov35-Tisochrysis_lutea.AAC.5
MCEGGLHRPGIPALLGKRSRRAADAPTPNGIAARKWGDGTPKYRTRGFAMKPWERAYVRPTSPMNSAWSRGPKLNRA